MDLVGRLLNQEDTVARKTKRTRMKKMELTETNDPSPVIPNVGNRGYTLSHDETGFPVTGVGNNSGEGWRGLGL